MRPGAGTIVALAAACTTTYEEAPVTSFLRLQDPQQDSAPADSASDELLDYEHVLDTGIILRSPEDEWGAHLTFPVGVGWTTFDLSDISLDQVTSISVVPTVEFIVPLEESRRWTLLPFVGLGGAVQFGDDDLIGGRNTVGLANGGVQLMDGSHSPNVTRPSSGVGFVTTQR